MSSDFLERAVSLASKEFIRGFIIGQVALMLVLIVLVRLFFFRSTAGEGDLSRRTITFKKHTLPAASTRSRLMLDDYHDKGRESCQWMSTLIGSMIIEPVRRLLEGDGDFLPNLISQVISSAAKQESTADHYIVRVGARLCPSKASCIVLMHLLL
jgi:hypothetical protein